MVEKGIDTSILVERIKYACDTMSSSIYAIENGLGWQKGTIKRWKKRKPSWEKVLSVANFLDVSVDFLVGNTNNMISHKS